jgi:Cellulose binding domain
MMKRAAFIAGVIGASVVGSIATAVVAQATAAGCRVTYSVPSEWNGGFTGNVAVTNLGDPLDGWRLSWSFPSGQQVSQAWNATVTQSGSQVTAANVSWNGSLDTNATVSFGFNGQSAATNTNPSSFALNGVPCTGSTAPTTPGPNPTTPGPNPTTAGPNPTTSPPPPVSDWNPPSNLVTPLNEVWAHQEETYNNGNLYGFRNYGWDQLFANGGYINYCVRWDSSATVSAAQRDQIHAALARQYKKWIDVVVGHNGFPYADVPVRVVGWAVRDRAQLQWTDTSVDIYVNNIRENAPQCSEPCGRFFNRSGNYPNCPGGAARHYDHSLWLTDGFGGGHGGDWGQRMGREYFMNNINAQNMYVLLHEIGHTYGLDDFYDWTPTGQCCFLMKANTANQITEFDKWMFRDWWRHLKSRYGY